MRGSSRVRRVDVLRAKYNAGMALTQSDLQDLGLDRVRLGPAGLPTVRIDWSGMGRCEGRRHRKIRPDGCPTCHPLNSHVGRLAMWTLDFNNLSQEGKSFGVQLIKDFRPPEMRLTSQ